jgi:hypothetical protein
VAVVLEHLLHQPKVHQVEIQYLAQLLPQVEVVVVQKPLKTALLEVLVVVRPPTEQVAHRGLVVQVIHLQLHQFKDMLEVTV